MQCVVEFRKKHFWSGRLNLEALNLQLDKYREQGWRVVTIRPVTATFGLGGSCLVLLESEDEAFSPPHIESVINVLA